MKGKGGAAILSQAAARPFWIRMYERAQLLGTAAGAGLGSFIVSVFKLQPAWLWGMAGGVGGGLTAALAGYVLTRRWPVALRAVAALLILGMGFAALYMLAGGLWITDPRNIQVRPPGS